MPVTLPERDATRPTLGSAMETLRHRWGWFIALGAVASLFGVVALTLAVHATIATVYMIAIFMIVAGGTEITVGFGAKTWGRFFLWIAAGVLYLAAGAFALAQPGHAAIVLTLLLGTAMFAAGLTRVVIGSHMHSHARTMVMVSGGVTALVGLLVILGWPGNSFIILGTLLGVDLLFSGIMWIGFGLRLRAHA